MEGRDRWGVVDLYYSVDGETGGGYHLIVFGFFLVLLYFVALRSHSLHLGG